MSFFIVLNAAYNAHKRNPNDHKSYFNSLLAIFVSTYVTMGVLVAPVQLDLFHLKCSYQWDDCK